MIRWFIYLLIFLDSSILLAAKSIDYRSSNRLDPSDYLLGSYGEFGDPVFDDYRTISLDIDVGITSDCGRIDIKNTLSSALENVLDAKYLGRIGHDILAASPMLATCYFSPTWCAILKHMQIKANFLAELRLNQCNAINKFTDQRVNDYYEERSNCVQNSIKKENGDFEKAMDTCSNYQDYDLKSWSGGKDKTEENRLIQSTAEWAGFSGENAQRVVDITKSLIGDTIIKNGHASVDYGPKRIQFTPRTYLMDIKEASFKKLCGEILPKVVNSGGGANVYKVISEKDLKAVSGSNKMILDRQTLLSLSYMPYTKRKIACRKLSDALALGTYTDDMGKSLDFISAKIGTNPHLPKKKQEEADVKRQTLKDQIELTLEIENYNSTPLNSVLYQINKEGAKYMNQASERNMETEQGSRLNRHVDNIFFDCADGVGCQ